jgi:hypothetical protein
LGREWLEKWDFMKESKLEEKPKHLQGNGERLVGLTSFRNFSIVLRQTNGVNNLKIALSFNAV